MFFVKIILKFIITSLEILDSNFFTSRLFRYLSSQNTVKVMISFRLRYQAVTVPLLLQRTVNHRPSPFPVVDFFLAYIPIHSLSSSFEFQKYLTVLNILALIIDNDMKRIHDWIIQIKIFTSKFLFQIIYFKQYRLKFAMQKQIIKCLKKNNRNEK